MGGSYNHHLHELDCVCWVGPCATHRSCVTYNNDRLGPTVDDLSVDDLSADDLYIRRLQGANDACSSKGTEAPSISGTPCEPKEIFIAAHPTT